jgi:hypothetical protein
MAVVKIVQSVLLFAVSWLALVKVFHVELFSLPPVLFDDLESWLASIQSKPMAGIVTTCVFFLLCHWLRSLVAIVSHRLASYYKVTDERTLKKVYSNAWYATYYSLSFFGGAYLLFFYTKWHDVEDICVWSQRDVDIATYPMVNIYYYMQTAFYLHYLCALISGMDVKRRDYIAYLIHHVITLSLIFISHNLGYMHVGLAIFVIHDAADPWLHLGKMLKYTGAPDLHSTMAMVVFMIIFFVTRWFAYPLWIINDCLGHVTQDPLDIHAKFFNAGFIFLMVLFGLHLYWGAYILRMAWSKLVEGKDNEDINDE